jgi:hypothetical protein
MDNINSVSISGPLSSLGGLGCWYVSCGGAASSTFQLALGQKIRRLIPLKNTSHSQEFREFEAEVSLVIWCAWRLDGPKGPITSWDDEEKSIETELSKLIGTQIETIEALPHAWDLTIRFNNSLILRVFCDHVSGKPSFDGNWDLRTPSTSIAVGPGVQIRTEIFTSRGEKKGDILL